MQRIEKLRFHKILKQQRFFVLFQLMFKAFRLQILQLVVRNCRLPEFSISVYHYIIHQKTVALHNVCFGVHLPSG